jgi:myo-inositol 2-dehydrogenase/D-chiro-inositol 1-dehydrogenase
VNSRINIGLIGAGRIGRVHAENLTYHIPRAHLLAVADLDVMTADQLALDYNIPTRYSDYRELLDHPDLDAVLICSSSDTHAAIIMQAATAGKHIFCEKPIALQLEQIDRALTVVAQNGVKLQVGFNRRFDPNFLHIRKAIQEGEIGSPQLLRITSRDPAPPPLAYLKQSGGIFLDMTIHDFDMARYLIQDEVESMYVAGSVFTDPVFAEIGDLDTAVITLHFAKGTIGTIDNSRRAVYGYDQRVEVFGTKGSLVASNNTPHNVVFSDRSGIHSAKPYYFFLERYTQSYIDEVRAFVEAIEKDTSILVTGEDGRVPVLMGLTAWKSYRERRPVYLKEVDE